MRLLDPLFRSRDTDPQSHRRTLLEAPFLIAHRTLTAFLEAYFVVADRLGAQPPEVPIDKTAFIGQCCNVGKQYLMQQRLRHPECLSQELFGNALLLAANRGLLNGGGADLNRRRTEFARELQTIVSAVDAIGALDRQRLPHMIESAA
jgi:glycerol-3-phosphate O-acyltransferase